MKNNAYLYGEGVEVPQLDIHMVVRRLELLVENREALYEVNYKHRDNAKIRDINEAIKFWEQLSRIN